MGDDIFTLNPIVQVLRTYMNFQNSEPQGRYADSGSKLTGARVGAREYNPYSINPYYPPLSKGNSSFQQIT